MSKNRDAVSVSFVKDDDGKVGVEGDKLMEVWRAHYDKIYNKEFAWDKNSLTNVSPVCEPSERISALEVSVAIEKTKQDKSVGPIGVVAEPQRCPKLQAKLLHCGCPMCVMLWWLVKDGKVPEDCSRSWMVNVYITLLHISHAIHT